MPRRPKRDTFDRECPSCGNEGMVGEQLPTPDGPTDGYRCPECGATTTGTNRREGGTFVSKR